MWMLGNASPWGCNIWDLNSRKEPVMEIRKWAFWRGNSYYNNCKRNKKSKGRRGSDIFVLAYGSGFKTYPPSSHFPLIFCLCPVTATRWLMVPLWVLWQIHHFRLLLGMKHREYAISVSRILMKKYCLRTLSNRSHLFINMKTEKTLLWLDLVFIFPLSIAGCLWMSHDLEWFLPSLKEWNLQVLIPTQEISSPPLIRSHRLYLALLSDDAFLTSTF